jgi:hypothetical protein
MLEAVVVVGVLLALAVGGFFAYGPIVENAKMAKLKSAVSEVHTAVTVSIIDGDSTTSPKGVIDTYNASTNKIRFGIRAAEGVVAIPAMSTEAPTEDYIPTSDNDFCLTATSTDTPDLTAEAGNCAVAPDEETSTPPEEEKEEIPVPITVSLLKNGNFSEGLTHWGTPVSVPANGVGSGALATVLSGEAVLKPADYRSDAIRQTVNVPSEGIAYLQYSYRLFAYSTISDCSANLSVNIYDTAGALLKKLATHCFTGPSTPKTIGAADFTEFAGKNVQVEFLHINKHYDSGRTVYLDDIQIESTNGAPASPTGVTVSVDDTDATINWTAPASGYTTVTSYKVKPYRNGVALPELDVIGSPPAPSTVFKGLTSGGTYKFEVKATNKLGTSAASASSEPFVKTAKMLENGDFSAGLTGWKTSTSKSASGAIIGTLPVVTSGEVVLKPGDRKWSSLRQTVTVPSGGVSYLQYNYRWNAGTIPPNCDVNLNVKVYSVKDEPLGEIAKHCAPGAATTSTPGTVDLAAYAGQDIKIEFYFNNNHYVADRTAFLDNVQLENGSVAPSAPTGVTVSVDDTDATVSWNAPSSGYASTTSYTVTPYRNGAALPVIEVIGSPPATSAVFKGITSGGTYKFDVKATNKLGTSPASAPSGPFTKTVKLVENGDFSTGLTGWKTSTNQNAAGSNMGALPTVTAGEAVLKPGDYKWGAMRQTVSVPSSGTPKLNYDYRFNFGYVGSCSSHLTVKIYNAKGDFLKEATKHCAPQAATTMALQSTDLAPYAGQDIKIEFTFTHNYFDTAKTAFVDNVSVTS